MGYFGNGFAFGAAPDWTLLASCIRRSVALRGYRHRTAGLWLLDVWAPSSREHWPFTEEVPANLFRGQVLSRADEELLENLLILGKHVQSDEPHIGADLARNASGIAKTLSMDVFCFAGDDEGVDVAARCSAAGIGELRAGFESGAIEYSGGDIRVTPLLFEDDDFEEEPEYQSEPEDFDELSHMRGVAIEKPRTMKGGRPFYGNAVNLWPVGDPAALLSVGTWDPFLNLESDYDLVFEMLDSDKSSLPGAIAPAKPWWQFWRT